MSLSFETFLKKKKKGIIGSLIGVLLGLIIIGIAFYYHYNNQNNVKSFHEIIYNEEGIEKYSYIDTNYTPYLFAVNEEEHGKLYIVFDEKYIYIAKLDDVTVDKINEAVNEKKSYRLSGYSRSITKDIKDLALEAYNEEVEEDAKLDEASFDEYFGVYYLDTLGSDEMFDVLIFVGGFIDLIALIMMIVYIIQYQKIKKYLKTINPDELAKVEKEINDQDAFHYQKACCITTKDYILDYSKNLQIINYNDIIWYYRYEMRTHGIRTNLAICVHTKDLKQHMICNIDGVTKKQSEVILEVMETIKEHNPKAYVGFDKEIRKKVKEEYSMK